MTGTPNLTLSTARTNRELEAATEVLVSSFQNAPNFVAVLPNASARGWALPHPFRFVVRDAAAFGGTVLAMCGADVVGAAVWFPPKRARLTFRRQLRALPDLARTFAAAPSSFVRFVRLGGTLEERKPREPHLYLAALGVAPAWQDRRVGTTLLRTGLAQADASGQRCSLETFSEENVRFYERHGFVVTGSSDDLNPRRPALLVYGATARSSGKGSGGCLTAFPVNRRAEIPESAHMKARPPPRYGGRGARATGTAEALLTRDDLVNLARRPRRAGALGRERVEFAARVLAKAEHVGVEFGVFGNVAAPIAEDVATYH